MTKHRGMAAGAAIFVLLGVAISPLVAAPANSRSAESERVSVAISSGSQLTLATVADVVRPARDGKRLTCDHVFRLGIADVGVNCAQPNDSAPARIVRLAD